MIAHTPNLGTPKPPRISAVIATAITGVIACILVGMATNAVNGLVSPLYFVTILRWHHLAPEAVWRASIAQGAFEGVVFGFVLSTIFTIAMSLITGGCATYRFAAKHLLGIVAGALGLWLLGGLFAMGLAALSPGFYRAAFIGVPEEFGEMLAYAWVGGSIWGVQFGGVAGAIVGLIALRANWRSQRKA